MTELTKISKQNLERRDSRPINLDADKILCFSCVRNESIRLPYFLEYHRNIRVNRFFLVDNASNDGTVDYLLSEKKFMFNTLRPVMQKAYAVLTGLTSSWLNMAASTGRLPWTRMNC